MQFEKKKSESHWIQVRFVWWLNNLTDELKWIAYVKRGGKTDK